MKNQQQKRGSFSKFDEALRRACDGPQPIMDGPEYREFIRVFAARHRRDFETLYVRHKVPPSEILLDVGLCQFSPVLQAPAAKMIRSRKSQLEMAARLDHVAKDLEVWDLHAGPVHGVPDELGSNFDLCQQLRAKATAIRRMKTSAHRPRDVMFTERALCLTYTFLTNGGRPLWDYTARLIMDHQVKNGQDSVKKAVFAAIKRNPHGSMEKRVSLALRSQKRDLGIEDSNPSGRASYPTT